MGEGMKVRPEPCGPSVVGQTQFLVRDARPREHRQTRRWRPHFRASARRRPIDPLPCPGANVPQAAGEHALAPFAGPRRQDAKFEVLRLQQGRSATMCYMSLRRPAEEPVGVRELRQNLSVYLARLATGTVFRVTDRGRAVALSFRCPSLRRPSNGWSRPDRATAPTRDLAALGRPGARTKRSISGALQDIRDDRPSPIGRSAPGYGRQARR